jgi:hypothetical protein
MFVANWWILWLLGLGSLNPNQPAGLPLSPFQNPGQAIVAIQAPGHHPLPTLHH